MLTIFCILIVAGVIIEFDTFSFREMVWLGIVVLAISVIFG